VLVLGLREPPNAPPAFLSRDLDLVGGDQGVRKHRPVADIPDCKCGPSFERGSLLRFTRLSIPYFNGTSIMLSIWRPFIAALRRAAARERYAALSVAFRRRSSGGFCGPILENQKQRLEYIHRSAASRSRDLPRIA
jgi:hypothetical protein